jgi:hypothetical protein
VKAPSCLPIPPAEVPSLERGLDDEEREGLLSNSLDETAILPADLGQSGFDVLPEGQHTLVERPRSTSRCRPHRDC